VDVPKVTASRHGNEYFWQEQYVAMERLPVEPDAMFTLRFGKTLPSGDCRALRYLFQVAADRSVAPWRQGKI
jgi:hypothetical protein